jgi:hypothetical protein
VDPWHTLLIAIAVVALVEGVFIVGLMRQIGGIYMQVGPPRPGATDGHGPEPGETLDPATLALTRPALLFFLSPTCSLCPEVARAIPVAQAHFRELDFIPAVIGAATDEKLAYTASLGSSSRADLDELFERWNIAGTPYAVGLDAGGTVRSSGIVNSLPQIENMAESLLMDAREADVINVVGHELEEAV